VGEDNDADDYRGVVELASAHVQGLEKIAAELAAVTPPASAAEPEPISRPRMTGRARE
jgi:hypothetical protein